VHLSLVAKVLWAAGFVSNTGLLFVLLYKRRYRTVPCFTAWIGFGCLFTITLFLGYRLGSKHLYKVLYWSGAFPDLLLQVAVVLEIAHTVLRRSGRWVDGARRRMIFMGSIAPFIALGMACFMRPAAQTALDGLGARSDLFATILICLLLTTVMVASQQLGLGWRSHIMRESYGLAVWIIVGFVTDTLHAYWRTLGHFTFLENIRGISFLGALIYWIITFWQPEVENLPMPSDAKKDLDDLAARIEYAKSQSSTSGAVPK
jgi:hypothetical protein